MFVLLGLLAFPTQLVQVAREGLIRELRLPDGAVIAMLVRDRDIIPPRGTTRVEPGD